MSVDLVDKRIVDLETTVKELTKTVDGLKLAEKKEKKHNYKTHFFVYAFSVLSFGFFLAIYDKFNWGFFVALMFGFLLINPDVCAFFGIEYHRNFITHSALYPILIYWILHRYWNMTTADELGIILFFPEIVHLIVDFHDAWNDPKGCANIIFTIPFVRYRFKPLWSQIYVFANIVGMAAYMIWVL